MARILPSGAADDPDSLARKTDGKSFCYESEYPPDPSVSKEVAALVKAGKMPLPSEVRDTIERQIKERKVKSEDRERVRERLWVVILPYLRQAARIGVDHFCELVAVDDDTGLPIRQSDNHKRWAKLADKYARLLIWSHVESAKTTQLSILRTVWELGRDPSLRFAILSNTKGQAEQILRTIALLVERNEEVHAIFPNLKPDPAGPWTNSKLRVVRKGNAKDASVRAVGVHGDLTGARVDRLIVDDILDPENCESGAGRKKLSAWYKAVAVGRLTHRARILVVGTAYHPKDLLHELSRLPGWKWFRFPVVNKEGKPLWPDRWPAQRIEHKKAELGPAEFARQLLCKARDDGESRFKQEWIDLALRAGDGLTFLDRVDPEDLEEGSMLFTGVDLAVQRMKRSDETVFLTFLEDKKGRRRLIDITAGKYTGPQIIERLKQIHDRYRSLLIVENNAAQDYLVQFATDDSNIPIVPFTTGKQKRDPIFGVEGMAIELANAKWVFPNTGGRMHPELEKLVTEMLFYTPSKHCGDRLMSAWFAREKARDVMGYAAGGSDGTAVTARSIGAGSEVNKKPTDISDNFEPMPC